MFIDTHCHLSMIEQRGLEIKSLLTELAQQDFTFILDAGTEYDDFEKRIQYAHIAQKLLLDMRFSLGIFPSIPAIADRYTQIAELEKTLIESLKQNVPVCAIGECGLDLHWNTESTEETELFELQIELAKKHQLPLIIHSRDAFEQTISCLKNMQYHNGLMHCFSYGLSQAKELLDLGWYISFSGSITYGKTTKRSENAQLAAYIPADLLLLETDSPYLAPEPYRQEKINTSLLIPHTYDFIAQARNQPLVDLQKNVYANTLRLFGTQSSSVQ